MEVAHSSVEDIKLNLGIFIAGYKGEESKYMSTISGWGNVFDKVVLFTDSRLDERSMFDYISKHTRFEKYDFATMGIPILDWYIENAEFLKSISLAQYITYYSDLCRTFVMKHLNDLYPNDINGFTQATYYLVESETSTTDLKAQLVKQSQDKLVVYGNDRNFMLDGQLKLRSSNQDFTSRICLGFNMGKKNLLDKNFFRRYGALNPFENMIRLSIANPDVDEEGVLELFRNFMGGFMVGNGRANVIFDYEAEDETTITIKAGNVVVLVNSSDANWWEGYLEGNPGNIGFFPASFVNPQVDDSKPINAVLKMIITGKDNELVQEEKEEFIKDIPLRIGAPIGLMYKLREYYERIDGGKKFSTFFNRIPVGEKHWSKFGVTTDKGGATESPLQVQANLEATGPVYDRVVVVEGGGKKTKKKKTKRNIKGKKNKKSKRRTFKKSKRGKKIRNIKKNICGPNSERKWIHKNSKKY